MKKKILLGLLCGIMVLGVTTGCGNEKKENQDSKINSSSNGVLSCTKVIKNDDGTKTDETVELTYSNNIVKKAVTTSISTFNEGEADSFVDFTQTYYDDLGTISGVNFEIKKTNNTTTKSVLTIDYDLLDEDEVKKAIPNGTDDEESFYKKSKNLDEFKEKKLDGYTCK